MGKSKFNRKHYTMIYEPLRINSLPYWSVYKSGISILFPIKWTWIHRTRKWLALLLLSWFVRLERLGKSKCNSLNSHICVLIFQNAFFAYSGFKPCFNKHCLIRPGIYSHRFIYHSISFELKLLTILTSIHSIQSIFLVHTFIKPFRKQA